MFKQSFLRSKIPTTVITGFLGSGKTTMIRHMLENANGKKIALIINEFGDLGVDGGLLKGCGLENCHDDDVIELNNGCICCTVAEDFIPTMTKLLERDDRPDHIVIETSGLALPQPLVAAFNWPEIKTQVTVDGVITVIDAPAVAEGRFADNLEKIDEQRKHENVLNHESPLEELFEDQIHAADLIVLNKVDLIDEKTLENVRDIVSSHSDRVAKMVSSSFGSLGTDLLLGLGVGTEDDIDNRKSHHEMHHAEGVPHNHDEFNSFVVHAPTIKDPKLLAEKLQKIIADHDILRLKGFVNVADKPMRLVIQAVGQRIDFYYDRPWLPNERHESHLVVIALHDVDQAVVDQAIKAINV